MRRNLTAASVDALKPPERGQVDIWDKKQGGFGVRLSYGGKKVWVLMYRQHGIKRRLVLGEYPRMGLADARKAAQAALGDVADGGDPAQDRVNAKSEPTFADVAKEYLERHAVHKRPRSRAEDIRILDRYLLPLLANRKISDIKRRDIVALLDEIVQRGPIMANRVKALVSTIFRFAEDRELIQYNPCVRLRSPAPDHARDRVLSEDELYRLFVALEQEPFQHQVIVKVALLTAARRSELLHLTWSEIDGNTWLLPAERSKNKRECLIPLVPSVMEAIHSLPCGGPQFVFGRASKASAAPTNHINRWWNPLIARAGIENAVFHDLRRSTATQLHKLGIEPHIVERVLNHVQGGIAAVYNQHSYENEKRSALLRWERKLKEITSGEKPESNMIALRAS